MQGKVSSFVASSQTFLGRVCSKPKRVLTNNTSISSKILGTKGGQTNSLLAL